MGWKKSSKQFKSRGSKSGTCFTCGKSGHWSKDCPRLEGSVANGHIKPKDGEDMLDLVADELILADSSKMTKSDEKIDPTLSLHPISCPEKSAINLQRNPSADQDDIADALDSKKAFEKVDCQAKSARKRKSVADRPTVLEPRVTRRGLRSRGIEADAEKKQAEETPVLDDALITSELPLNEEPESIPVCSAAPNSSSPAFGIDDVPSVAQVGAENMKETLQTLFGHDDFRSGQEEALERVLAGKSTLFISATGGGKSLCYQLPAYRLNGTTLVVSPLLSLIQDQLEHLPSSIRGATLNSQQTQDEYHSVVQRLKAGEVDVLFVAPERLFTDAFISVARCLPPFPLVCIDEVHCISEWAHNFRPSYLRLRPLFRDVLHARCILGLTATATRSMEREIIDALGIEPDGIVRSDLLRKNLRLTVSRDKNRQLSLLDMLQKDPRFKTGSVIVYCSLRAQCEDVAKYLIGQSVSAAYYHAGRTPRDRQSIQNRFFSGKLRVVVATVAFGMGLDKSNVRGIIHYSCPQSIESYVQEIGRAGRDGKTAHCHLFLHEDDETRMRSFAHGEGIEKINILRILNHVLVDSVDKEHTLEEAKMQRQVGEYVQIDEEDDVLYDVARESIETILCFLEQRGLVEVCNSNAAYGTLAFLTSQRRELEQSSRVVAAIVRLASPRNGQWKFTPALVASRLNCSISQVTRELRSLKAQRLLRVEWSGRAYICRILPGPSNISDAVADVAEVIHQRFVALEQRKVTRLQTLHNMLTCVAEGSWADATEERTAVVAASTETLCHGAGQEHIGILARMIGDYFTHDRQSQRLNEEESITCSEGAAASGSDRQSMLRSSAADQEVSSPTDRFLRADIINLLHNIQKDNPLLTGYVHRIMEFQFCTTPQLISLDLMQALCRTNSPWTPEPCISC
jgi:RecQ family ATP-dependent DNA helicase